MEEFLKYFDGVPSFDLIYIVITILSVIKSFRQGFVLSILSMTKWVLAYLISLFLFPKIKHYVKDIIDNEYVLDIVLGISIFVIVIFIILLINKGISKAVTYSGLGSLDKFFGFCFGFLKGYIVLVCLFTAINIVYNYKKWPINLNRALTFPWVENGSKYLIKGFPDQKQYEDTKNKIQKL